MRQGNPLKKYFPFSYSPRPMMNSWRSLLDLGIFFSVKPPLLEYFCARPQQVGHHAGEHLSCQAQVIIRLS
jgi:hypothetical protein